MVSGFYCVGKTAPLRGDCDAGSSRTGSPCVCVSERQPRFEGIATPGVFPAEVEFLGCRKDSPASRGLRPGRLFPASFLIIKVGKTAPLRGDCDFFLLIEYHESVNYVGKTAPLRGDCDTTPNLSLRVSTFTVGKTAPLRGDCDSTLTPSTIIRAPGRKDSPASRGLRL